MLTPGELTPAIVHSFETKCLGFFENKDVPKDKQVCKILAGLKDTRIQDWISVDRDRFLAMSFSDFMTEFRAGYLPEDWKEITCIELLGMLQNADAFWDFAVQVQTKNLLLRGTPSYLKETELCHRIESGMTQKLALRCHLEKCSKVEKFNEWLTEVKCVDDLIRVERAEFEQLAKATRNAGRRANTLAEPSRRANSNNSVTAASTSIANSNSTTCVTLPRLTDIERKLLSDNGGCFKCRHVFVPHLSTACPNGFPNPSSYKPLTQNFVDSIKQRLNKPVAALLQPNDTAGGPSSANMAPVAAVMGVSMNPVAYMPCQHVQCS
jgi:hypothetical protein